MGTETDNPHGGPKPYTNPYLAGILLGVVLLASFVVLGAGLGASGGIRVLPLRSPCASRLLTRWGASILARGAPTR